MPRCGNSARFVGHQDVNNAIAMLHGTRADLLWLEDAQTAAFDHGRAAHADVAGLRGDDDVAATEQCRIAGKAAPGHDAQHRHLAVEPRKAGKGRHMQAGYDWHVHITRTATTAFGKQHHRQFLLQGNAQHAVGLLMVAHALRAGQHRRVIGHNDSTAVLSAEQRAVDASDAGHHAVSRRVFDQVFFTAPTALRCHGERAVFEEGVGVAQIGDVLARRALTQSVALGNSLGTMGVERRCVARKHTLQVGARRHRCARRRCQRLHCSGQFRPYLRGQLERGQHFTFSHQVAIGME